MSENKPASTELTGGAGFTYEDTVVAYYLAQLLGRQRATAQSGQSERSLVPAAAALGAN
jgi:hypothetical protein